MTADHEVVFRLVFKEILGSMDEPLIETRWELYIVIAGWSYKVE